MAIISINGYVVGEEKVTDINIKALENAGFVVVIK